MVSQIKKKYVNLFLFKLGKMQITRVNIHLYTVGNFDLLSKKNVHNVNEH